jgi:hypothetical protein
MEPEGSLLHSQEPAICSYPEYPISKAAHFNYCTKMFCENPSHQIKKKLPNSSSVDSVPQTGYHDSYIRHSFFTL